MRYCTPLLPFGSCSDPARLITYDKSSSETPRFEFSGGEGFYRREFFYFYFYFAVPGRAESLQEAPPVVPKKGRPGSSALYAYTPPGGGQRGPVPTLAGRK